MRKKYLSIMTIVGGIVLLGAGCTAFKSYSPSTKPTEKTTSSSAMMKQENTTSEQKNDTITTNEVPHTEETKKSTDKSGAYEAYEPAKLERAKTGKVILFFKANWCVTCKSVDADITAETKYIPENVNILRVDYDTSAELKKKYGVTYQHTFVQVDANGTLIKKWSGGATLEEILAQIK